MSMLRLLIMLLAQATATITPPAFVFSTPGSAPTPLGQLVLATAIVNHGQPIQFTELEAGVEVYVNGQFLGDTNPSGTFTITFPTAGKYAITVGDYPQKVITVH